MQDDERLLQELSGSDEKGVRQSVSRSSQKTALTSVLLSSNPWIQRDLNRKISKIDGQMKRRERTLDWNQRQFFIKQLFDADENLRFCNPVNDDKSPITLPKVKVKTAKSTGNQARMGTIEGEQQLPTIRRQSATPSFGKNIDLQLGKSNTDSLGPVNPKAEVVDRICEDELIERLTLSLPVGLLVKASEKASRPIQERKKRLLKQNQTTIERNFKEDERWKKLQNSLVKSLY
ncbi:unnamed protein product [Dimorphilus gyrociliatus]|uniref:Uncharacterized protein n=1 Tax=Dimorphilus gyrociliatus TaxID=2664684 RepID=A0A7I8VUB0_9ANNE|nr:unnamed protein product [Dimorphilus gyrociliatus]